MTIRSVFQNQITNYDFTNRAGWFLGILVISWYWNEKISVLSKFQRSNIIAFGIIAVLLCLETLSRVKD